jgi:UDP-2,3-diacylglucosamine pyrophosphatase LpxH
MRELKEMVVRERDRGEKLVHGHRHQERARNEPPDYDERLDNR